MRTMPAFALVRKHQIFWKIYVVISISAGLGAECIHELRNIHVLIIAGSWITLLVIAIQIPGQNMDLLEHNIYHKRLRRALLVFVQFNFQLSEPNNFCK